MKLYLNLKNVWKIFILVFILSSCSNIGGIVEIAVKDVVNNPLDSKEIIQSVNDKNIASSHKEKITQNNSIIQTLPKVIANPRYKSIKKKLIEQLSPDFLEIRDDSALHKSHGNIKEGQIRKRSKERHFGILGGDCWEGFGSLGA